MPLRLGETTAVPAAEPPEMAKLTAAPEIALPLASKICAVTTSCEVPSGATGDTSTDRKELLGSGGPAIKLSVTGLMAIGDPPVFTAMEIDPTSLELLSLAIEQIRDQRILLLATARPEFTPPWPGHHHVSTLSLNRFGRSDGEALIVGITKGKPLPPEVRDQVGRQLVHEGAADPDPQVGDAHGLAPAGVEEAREHDLVGERSAEDVAQGVEAVEEIKEPEGRGGDRREPDECAPGHDDARKQQPPRAEGIHDDAGDEAEGQGHGDLAVGVARGHILPGPAQILEEEVVEEGQAVGGKAHNGE